MAVGLTTCDMCGATEHPRNLLGPTFTQVYNYGHWDFCPKCEPKSVDFIKKHIRKHWYFYMGKKR